MSRENARSIADVGALDGEKFEDFILVWGRIILSYVLDQMVEAIDRRNILCTSD